MTDMDTEKGSVVEGDVTQRAEGFLNSRTARVTDELVIRGVLAGVAGLATVSGVWQAIEAFGRGEVLKAAGLGLASLALVGFGFVTGRKAVPIVQELLASEQKAPQ